MYAQPNPNIHPIALAIDLLARYRLPLVRPVLLVASTERLLTLTATMVGRVTTPSILGAAVAKSGAFTSETRGAGARSVGRDLLSRRGRGRRRRSVGAARTEARLASRTAVV